MALLLLDGFETYGTATTGLNQIWSNPVVAGASMVAPGRGDRGRCLQMPNDGGNYLQHHCGVQKQTWTVGFAVYVPQAATYSQYYYLYQARDDANSYQVTLTLGGANNLKIWFEYWLAATPQETSLEGSFRMGQWNYVEIQFTIDASAGSYEVRVNGTTVMSGSGFDTDFTGAGEVSQHVFMCASNNQQIDDIYICDDSGAEFNDWLGDQYTLVGLTPSADTAQLDWSAQPAGTHYMNIDEDSGNDNTDYVYDSNVGNEDLYDYDDLPVSPDDILFIDIWTQAALDIAGSETLIVTCQSGATHDSGSIETITDTTYATVRRQLLQDPNTAAAWTEVGLNAAQFGIEIG